jgi:hypothetical protein
VMIVMRSAWTRNLYNSLLIKGGNFSDGAGIHSFLWTASPRDVKLPGNNHLCRSLLGGASWVNVVYPQLYIYNYIIIFYICTIIICNIPLIYWIIWVINIYEPLTKWHAHASSSDLVASVSRLVDQEKILGHITVICNGLETSWVTIILPLFSIAYILDRACAREHHFGGLGDVHQKPPRFTR